MVNQKVTPKNPISQFHKTVKHANQSSQSLSFLFAKIYLTLAAGKGFNSAGWKKQSENLTQLILCTGLSRAKQQFFHDSEVAEPFPPPLLKLWGTGSSNHLGTNKFLYGDIYQNLFKPSVSQAVFLSAFSLRVFFANNRKSILK